MKPEKIQKFKIYEIDFSFLKMKNRALPLFWNWRVYCETFTWSEKPPQKRFLKRRKRSVFYQNFLPTALQYLSNNRIKFLLRWKKLKTLVTFDGYKNKLLKKRIYLYNAYFLANSFSFISIKNVFNRRMFWWVFFNKQVTPNRYLFNVNFMRRRRIAKIKFKPGYTRVWKKIRLVLMYWLGLRFPYPARFTQFLLRVRYPAMLTPYTTYNTTAGDFLFRLLPFQFKFNEHQTIDNLIQLRVNTLRISNYKFILLPFDWIQISYNFIFLLFLPYYFLKHALFLKKFWAKFKRYWLLAKRDNPRTPKNLARFFAYTKLFPRTFIYYENDWQTGLFYLLPVKPKKTSIYYSISPISWTMYNWKYIT